MTESSKIALTRFFIASIVAVIVAIYYFSELRPFEYEGYDDEISRLERIAAELNSAIIQTKFGFLRYYDPIDKSLSDIKKGLNEFKIELQRYPSPDITEHLKILETAILEKERLSLEFKRLNPIVINAIYQFSTLLAQIIESQASTQLVESCLQQDYRYQIVDKINNLFRGILMYINFQTQARHDYLVHLVEDIKQAPNKFPKLDEVLAYAEKILELQPQLSKIDSDLLKVPVVQSLNALDKVFSQTLQRYLEKSYAYRILLYLLVFILLVVLRWTFSRLRRIVTTLHIEVQRKIKAEKELEEINRRLEHRVTERTRELTAKNNDLNQALANLKEAQNQLIIQEKMASVGMLTTGIAHEIKNPLNFVNNFSDISVELVTELSDKIQAHKESISASAIREIEDILTDLKTNCSKIKEHGERADNIVKNMLLHSQEAGTQKELIEIQTLLEDNIKIALESFKSTHGKFDVKIDTHIDPNARKILAAPQSLGRVFIYLIDNALYALKEQQIHSPITYCPTLSVSLEEVANNMIIKIRDNGIGISQKNLDRVFEPFFTTKPTRQGNTGLGLSICYDTIVKQHEGELTVRSEEGLFTEFTVTLPLFRKKANNA